MLLRASAFQLKQHQTPCLRKRPTLPPYLHNLQPLGQINLNSAFSSSMHAFFFLILVRDIYIKYCNNIHPNTGRNKTQWYNHNGVNNNNKNKSLRITLV